MPEIGRTLVILGGLIVIVGLALMLGPRIPFLGRLPGDIFYQRDGVTVAFPIVTCILISIVLTVVLNLAARIVRQ